MKQRYGFGRFAIPGRVMLPAAVALALLTAAALAGIFTAQAQNAAPRVANVEIISAPASGTSYTTGEQIWVRVTFDQAVLLKFRNDDQRPQLKLSIGAIQNRTARNVDHEPELGGDNVLIFRYDVNADDHENYGISIIPRFGSNGFISPLSVPEGGRIFTAAGGSTNPAGDADLRLGEHIITLAYGHRVNAATPEPPANVQAVQDRASINITWEQPGSIQPDYYILERRFHGDAPPGESAGPIAVRVSGRHYTFNDYAWLYNGATYSYRVQGYLNNRHHSRISEAATIAFTWTEYCDPKNPPPFLRVKNSCVFPPTPTPAPTAAPPPTPGPNAAPRVTASTHDTVTLDWSDMVGAGGAFQLSPAANGFHISRRSPIEVEYTDIVELPLSRTAYQDTGLLPGTRYTWRLYEDLPHHRYNLMGEVSHTTMPDPTPTPPAP